MASNDLSQEIEDDILSCPICEHQLTQPKALPCQHTYCCTCLQQLAQRAENGHLSCPECRKVAVIPANGVEAFPTNFLVANVLEKVQKCRAEKNKKTDNTDMCDTHKQEAHIVCVNCQVVVCNTCLQSDHKEHELKHIDQERNNIVREVKKLIEDSVKILDRPWPWGPHNEVSLRLNKHFFQQDYEHAKRQIELKAAEIIRTVEQQKESLLKELKQRQERELGKINKQEKKYLASKGMLQAAKTAAERAIDRSKPLLYKDIVPRKSHLKTAISNRNMYFAKYASLLGKKGGVKFEPRFVGQLPLGHIIEVSDGRIEESDGPSARVKESGCPSVRIKENGGPSGRSEVGNGPSGRDPKPGPSDGICGASERVVLRLSVDKKKQSLAGRAGSASGPKEMTSSPIDLFRNLMKGRQSGSADCLPIDYSVARCTNSTTGARDHDNTAGEGTSISASTASEPPAVPRPRCKVLRHPQVGVNISTTSAGCVNHASALASTSNSRPDDAVQPEATGSATSSGSCSNGQGRRAEKRPYIYIHVESDEDDDDED